MKTENYFFVHASFVICLLFLSISVYCQQESVIYIGKNGRLTNQQHADIMQKIKVKSDTKTLVQSFQQNDTKWEKIYTERFTQLNDSTYQVNGSSKSDTQTSLRIFKPMADGTFQFKDIRKNQVVRQGFSTTKIPLTINGQLTEYYPKGQKKSVSDYRNNELISNQNWNENGEKYIDNIFYSTDTGPEFVPGNKALHQYLIKGFKNTGIDLSAISGSVIIAFVVMEDGTIDGLRLIKGLLPTVNAAAFQSFSNLKGEWKPARLNNQNVRYYQVFPINFIYKEHHLEFAEMRGSILHWAGF